MTTAQRLTTARPPAPAPTPHAPTPHAAPHRPSAASSIGGDESGAHPARDETDLRRHHRRDMVATLVDRAQAAKLPPEDMALLRAAYGDGRTAVELAHLLAGASRTPRGRDDARSIRRRIRRLAQRIMSPRFVFVMRHRDTWPATRRRVAELCILQGHSLRDASKELGITLHTVRRHHEAIQALFEAVVVTTRRSA
jgi:DNA-binding CsgD family transcriptional regulator